MAGRTHYEESNGVRELREALTEKAHREYDLDYDPSSEVLVTAGATEAIFAGLFSLVEEDTDILIPDPGFVAYEPCARLVGGNPIRVPLYEANGFKPVMRNVTSLITTKSRVMILNYPNNPTGAVLSRNEIAELARIAVEQDLVVISDEVYERILYDGRKHHCVASFPEMRDRTLVVNSFSKTYAMTGLRVGYVYGPKDLVARVWLAHQYIVACCNSVAQYMAVSALKGDQSYVDNMVREFDRRRVLVHRRLNEIPGFRCSLPEGAFYAFPNIEDFGMSSQDFARFLADKAHVLVVPGSAFGGNGEGFVRLSFAAAYGTLERALDRIEEAVRALA